MSILKILELLVVDFLQFLKAKSSTIWFIIKNIIVFNSLVALFLILNGMLFGFPPISEIAWWEPLANSYGELLGVMRGIWDSILSSPGSLAYHLKIFTHFFLVIAPAVSILLLIFLYLEVIHISFFFTGLISIDPADRQFTTFLQKYKFWLLALLILLTIVIINVALYDPRQSLTFNPSCGGQNVDIDGLKSISETHGFISALHSEIWAIMLFVAGFMLFMACTTLYSFDAKNAAVSYKDQNLIEIIWTTISAIIFSIILCSTCVPAYASLFTDDALDLNLSGIFGSNTMEREWYWSYEYGDYDQNSCSNTISMASPNESNNGWFGGFKNWWHGKSNQPLSPLETNQKNVDLLNEHAQGELNRCIQYNKEIDASSPRSAAIAKHKQEECFGYVTRLQKCTHQIHLNVARTSYGEAPGTFMSAMGAKVGEGVSQVAAPILEELADNGIRTTAEGLKK